jgi:hypothetical protein
VQYVFGVVRTRRVTVSPRAPVIGALRKVTTVCAGATGPSAATGGFADGEGVARGVGVGDAADGVSDAMDSAIGDVLGDGGATEPDDAAPLARSTIRKTAQTDDATNCCEGSGQRP